MQYLKALAFAAAIGSAVAQRPANTSICDYYTTALLKNNTAANQKLVLTLVVNTAVIGNYTKPNLLAVPGILAPGVYTDPVTGANTSVNLAPYFNGALASTNRGGMSGVSVNFLDDGGAAPLLLNMPSNGTSSNQYRLLTHLYAYFGSLLGCSLIGTADYPAYSGNPSMYTVHQFMDLKPADMGYFITQVALAAASFGVAASDLQVVGTALGTLFNVRCAPATTIIPAQGATLNSICQDATCPLAANASCPATNATAPQSAGATGSATGTASGSASATSSGAAAATSSKAAAATYGLSAVAAFGGLFALFL